MAEQPMKMMGTRVPADVAAIIAKLANAADRPEAYIIRKLIEESPRIKAELRRNGKLKKGA